MNRVEAMLKLYMKAHPELSYDECLKLMKEKERHFLGLDLTDEEVKRFDQQEYKLKGTFYKKRKRKK